MTDENVVPFGRNAKDFRQRSDDPWIEVLHVSKISKTIEPCSFLASMIGQREGAGAGQSALVLKSGETILLSLPYTQLVEKIDEGLSPVDLKEYCETIVPVIEPEIGTKAEDSSGVYIGQYKPKDRDGNSLGKIFNVFAAPQDLTDASGKKETFKYVNAVKRVAELKNWNGHDGTNYATDKELYQALKNGSYNGGWIIPTRDLLSGNDVNGNVTQQPDNLYAHKDKGALAGTFCTAASSGSDYPAWYWSSTEGHDPSGVRCIRFSGYSEYWLPKDSGRLSCRPVRLVACKAP